MKDVGGGGGSKVRRRSRRERNGADGGNITRDYTTLSTYSSTEYVFMKSLQRIRYS